MQKMVFVLEKMAVVTMETGINQSALIIIIIILSSSSFRPATLSAADLSNRWSDVFDTWTYSSPTSLVLHKGLIFEKMPTVTMETGINQSALRALFSATNRPILMKIDRNITYDD